MGWWVGGLVGWWVGGLVGGWVGGLVGWWVGGVGWWVGGWVGWLVGWLVLELVLLRGKRDGYSLKTLRSCNGGMVASRGFDVGMDNEYTAMSYWMSMDGFLCGLHRLAQGVLDPKLV